MVEPAALEPEPTRADAIAFFHDSPPRDIIEIFRRLPARSVLRLRSVCKVLRDVTSYRPILAAVHLLHPPQPLIYFDCNACPDSYFQLRDYCVEALDLRSDTLRPIFRFTDNNIANAEGVDAAPIIVTSKDQIHYGEVDGDDGGHDPRLMVHASINDLLLVSFINIWYVCNPATCLWAALPDLSDCDVIGLYEHVSSGEYRVLYHTGKDDEEASTCYYVLTVGAQEARSIGCPISPAAAEDMGLDIGLDPASLSPPVQLHGSLHWPPQERQGHHILVFDTKAEVFSWKTAPNPITNGRVQLLEMDHKLAMCVSKNGKPTL